MNIRSFLPGVMILILAVALFVFPAFAFDGPWSRVACTDTSVSHGIVGDFAQPPYGNQVFKGPVIEVQATKSPLFRNSTGNTLFNQDISQPKPRAVPGFRDTTTLMTPLMTSTPTTGTIPLAVPVTPCIRPLTTPVPAKFPIQMTGAPLLKTGTSVTGQSILPKITFPPQTPAPSQPDVPKSPDYVSNSTRTIEQRIFYYTNLERAKAGKTAYVYDSRLSDIARNDAVDMATRGFFDHINPDGESPTDRAKRQGYPIEKDYGSYYRIGVGENIAMVQHIVGTPDEIAQFIVNAWMNSPDHRANILDLTGADYTNLGVGVAYDPVNDKYLAVQEFF